MNRSSKNLWRILNSKIKTKNQRKQKSESSLYFMGKNGDNEFGVIFYCLESFEIEQMSV